MDTNLIFDVILAVLGLWLIVTAVRMKRSGRVSSLLLAEDDRRPKKEKEYAVYMFPRLMGFAAVCTGIGGLGVLSDVGLLAFPYWRYIEAGAFLVAFVVFYTQLRSARERFG